jgi:hypothetical protein
MQSSGPGLDSLETQKNARKADIEVFENELSCLDDQSAAQMNTAESQAKLTFLKNSVKQRSDRIQSRWVLFMSVRPTS